MECPCSHALAASSLGQGRGLNPSSRSGKCPLPVTIRKCLTKKRALLMRSAERASPVPWRHFRRKKKLWLLLGVCHSIPSWWLVWVNISILPFYKKVGQLRTSMTEVKGKEITQISLHDICSAPGRWSMYAHGSSGWSWIRSWNSLQELQGTRHWKLPKQAHEKYQHWKYNSTSLG